MSYKTKTIAEIVDEVDTKKIYLPAIQRKFVWREDQIIRLWDSIMRGYPFGTFLFWKIKKTVVNDKHYSMYEFIKDYHERDRYKNEPAGQPFLVSEGHTDETILSVLDGQQRLTALYISLKGSMSLKLPHKHKSNDNAYPKKELYFNILSETTNEDEDIAYKFSFLTTEEASKNDEHTIWYRVKDIVQYPDASSLFTFMANSSWIQNGLATKNISLLWSRIISPSEKSINYFEVSSDKIDDVLDIFVRVNSGGTVLSKTDLLFSTIVASWNNARDEIDNLLATVNRIGDHYSFTNDFIMRVCLYVLDLPTTLKVETFGNENIGKIESAWKDIESAIKDTINVLNELGFNSDNIVADNAVIPLIYYRYKFGSNAFKNDCDYDGKIIFDEMLEVRKFMVVAQIKHIFGQSTTSTLSTIRTVLKKHEDKFKLSHLQGLKFTGDKSLVFDEEDILSWIDENEKNAFTFMLLPLLYPNLKYGQKGFHQDHMHPYSAFEKDDELRQLSLPDGDGIMDDDRIKTWKHLRNTLPNLQLLEGRENESKNDEPLIDWLNNPANKENVKYLPKGVEYSLSNFETFIGKRKELMVNELKKVLISN